MMNPAYKEFDVFLKTIKRSKLSKTSSLFKAANDSVVNSLIEIAYNLLKGNIPLSESDIKNLRKHKVHITDLISRKISLKKKRNIILDNPLMLKVMLKVIFK